MSYPIPKDALDDRLAIVGTAGSGKTYAALGACEHLLARHSRLIFVDPLGVAWGLRLCEDGKTASPFQPVIFGGLHGDLPINEHAGALIGETVATMRESCIIDLSQLGTKAAERRFMLAFLTALYRHTNKEPVHLIVDEADMFAPQKLLDKDGDAAKLLGMMETVVRRGRVRGFIPWLITQRPAVLSKDVLSQADGLVALKLTSSQDRAAIGAWIEGQADRAEGNALLAALPGKQRGEAVLWIPARGILKEVEFPPKATYDSSRTPKRGEKQRTAELKPIDLGALQQKLAAVETEAKANDPRALKAEIAQLRRDLAAKPAEARQDGAVSTRQIETARKEGFGEGYAQGWTEGDRDGFARGAGVALDQGFGAVRDALKGFVGVQFVPGKPPRRVPAAPPAPIQSAATRAPGHVTRTVAQSAPRTPAHHDANDGLTGALRKVLDAIAWWSVAGVEKPRRERVAVIAGLSPKASTLGVYLAQLAQKGLVGSEPGAVFLTAEGRATATFPNAATAAELRDMARAMLSPAEDKVFEIIYRAHPNAMSRAEIAEQSGLSPTASTLGVYIARIAGYYFVETATGTVRASDWMFP